MYVIAGLLLASLVLVARRSEEILTLQTGMKTADFYRKFVTF